MADREKVIKGLNSCSGSDPCVNNCPYYDNCGNNYSCTSNLAKDALALLKEQENWLGIQQTVNGITFISSGTAKQGEKRGIMLGKALVYERLEKELIHRGLLTDDIRSAFVKVWRELE
jgi:hypothetical protein